MTDNYFRGCPPKMGGFREITEYQTSAIVDNNLQKRFNLPRDDEYRFFLQNNGNRLMNIQYLYYKYNNSCFNNRCIYSNDTTGIDPIVFTRDMYIYNNMPKGIPCQRYKDYRLF